MLSSLEMEESIFKYDTEVDLSQRNSSHTLLVELTGENKIVLDVGCATGYLGKALVQRGCRVVGIEANACAAALASRFYEAVLVADLDQVDLTASLSDARFDVVICGDVLEHLKDPQRVLRQMQSCLASSGYILASIPNIAHASVSLALLRGEFRYQEYGLLDSTHLHFFPLEGVRSLFERAGYRLATIHRVERGAFETEILLRQENFPEPVANFALQHPEARTYQFVVQAYPNSPSSAPTRLPKFDGKMLFLTPQGLSRPEESLLLQIQRLSELHGELSELKKKCQHLQSRLHHYENLPFVRTARWLRRKLLGLPGPPH